jgi:hypothetical protein
MMKHAVTVFLFTIGVIGGAWPSVAGDIRPITGEVVETLAGGGYSYLRLSHDGTHTWVAAPQAAVSVGDRMTVTGGSYMDDFHSPTLKRSFDRILFTDKIGSSQGTAYDHAKLPPGHPPIHVGDDCCPSETGTPAYHPPVTASKNEDACCPDHAGVSPHGGGLTGEVIETMNGGGYTYVQVRDAQRTVWAATSATDVRVGERVTVPDGLLIANFQSPSLQRTFDSIYFVERIQKVGR